MDTYQKIMVALDLSNESEAVLRKAHLIAESPPDCRFKCRYSPGLCAGADG